MLPHHTDLETFFSTKSKQELIQMLSGVYQLSHGCIAWELFGDYVYAYHVLYLKAEELCKRVDDFANRSMRGDYYAPFAMDAKNFMHIPEKTDIWFHEISLLIDLSCNLAQSGDRGTAKQCLSKLTALLDESLINDKVVFAHELDDSMVASRFNYRDIFNAL